MPAADSRPTVRMDCSILSHDAVTCGGSPDVSSTAFNAQPPDLPPVCLVDLGFAVLCQLAPHRRPLHPVLVHRLASLIHASFRLRLATTPLRFSSPSPPPGWAGDFHPLAVEHVRHTKQKAGNSFPALVVNRRNLLRVEFDLITYKQRFHCEHDHSGRSRGCGPYHDDLSNGTTRHVIHVDHRPSGLGHPVGINGGLLRLSGIVDWRLE